MGRVGGAEDKFGDEGLDEAGGLLGGGFRDALDAVNEGGLSGDPT